MPVAPSQSSLQIVSVEKRRVANCGFALPPSRVIIVFSLAITLLYGLPGIVEFIILKPLGPWVACVFLGNLLGCAILFNWGMRRTAASIYLGAALFEAYLLSTHSVSPTSLIWVTNLIPAAVIAVLAALITTPDGTFE